MPGVSPAPQRFRRRTEFDSESEDEGEEWSGGSESESGEEDEASGGPHGAAQAGSMGLKPPCLAWEGQ